MFELIAEILDDIVLNGGMPSHKKLETSEKIKKLRQASKELSKQINELKKG